MLLRFVGLLLLLLLLRLRLRLRLRLAERAFCALLLKLPPRMTRFSEPVGTRPPL